MQFKYVVWTLILAFILFSSIVFFGIKNQWGEEQPDSTEKTNKQFSETEVLINRSNRPDKDNNSPSIVNSSEPTSDISDIENKVISNGNAEVTEEPLNDLIDSKKGDTTKNDQTIETSEDKEQAIIDNANEIDQTNDSGGILFDEITGEAIPEIVDEVDEKAMMKSLKEECRQLSIALAVPEAQLEKAIDACVTLTLEEEVDTEK